MHQSFMQAVYCCQKQQERLYPLFEGLPNPFNRMTFVTPLIKLQLNITLAPRQHYNRRIHGNQVSKIPKADVAGGGCYAPLFNFSIVTRQLCFIPSVQYT